MNRKDPNFHNLTSAVQVRYHELREVGIGAIVKHATLVIPDKETALWESQVIGDHSPVSSYAESSVLHNS